MPLSPDLASTGNLSPHRLSTIPEVSRELEISRAAAERLVLAEVGGPTYYDGVNYTMARADLERLIARRENWATCTEPGIAVKVAPAAWNTEQERFVGWHRRLDPEALEAAVGRYWAVRDPAHLAERRAAFVATIGGWVVHVASILDVTEPVFGRGLRAFTLGSPTEDQLLAYEGKRLLPERGRGVLRLGGV
ncbi:hypothetical protein [Rhodococcus sp. (in: high G+C Gram-positive bacteria)]|uniref:hypothetical protein n=1 Tax=Rhodococcus sp. TaxID=1831 RepID=UPI003B8A5C98